MPRIAAGSIPRRRQAARDRADARPLQVARRPAGALGGGPGAAAGVGWGAPPSGPGPAARPDRDPPERLAHREALPRLDGDLRERPGRGRRHLEVDLVGGDLHHGLLGGDGVADRHPPLDHDALGDRLHVRQDDVDRAAPPAPPAPPGRPTARRTPPGPPARARRLGGGRVRPSAVAAAATGRSSARSAPTGDVVAGLGDDPRHLAAGRRGHLDVDLVGRDVQERVAGADLVALGHAPLDHDAFGDRLAELRQHNLDGL